MEWVLASHNRGKLAELRALMADLPVRLSSAADYGLSEPVEDACSFVENALIKARYVSAQTGLPALADDSGLIVDALNGAPGVVSARYAGPQASDADNIARLLSVTETLGDGQRRCRFVSLVVAVTHPADPRPLIAEGVWEGELLRSPRGQNGFGYDPIFLDQASGLSAAEFSLTQKGQISHRSKAFHALRAALIDKFQFHKG